MNYNAKAHVHDSSLCMYHARGCTDPLAVNFDSRAQGEDGSCEYPGCTIRRASNFNASATFDDGSCEPSPKPMRQEGCTVKAAQL